MFLHLTPQETSGYWPPSVLVHGSSYRLSSRWDDAYNSLTALKLSSHLSISATEYMHDKAG